MSRFVFFGPPWCVLISATAFFTSWVQEFPKERISFLSDTNNIPLRWTIRNLAPTLSNPGIGQVKHQFYKINKCIFLMLHFDKYIWIFTNKSWQLYEVPLNNYWYIYVYRKVSKSMWGLFMTIRYTWTGVKSEVGNIVIHVRILGHV